MSSPMELMNLPTELILIIANSVENRRDLAALARTCRFLYGVAIPILYAHNAKYEGSSALPWATKLGIMETVKLCIEYGANLNAHDQYRMTALIHATDNEDNELAKLLLDRLTTYIGACDIVGNSATFLAARNDDATMLDLLLHHGADANQVQRDGVGLLNIPILTFQAMQTLLRWGAHPGQMEEIGKTTLSRAIKSRSIRGVNLLLQSGAGNMADPANLEDDPLTVALDGQDESILRLLLKSGMHSSFAISCIGSSVLHLAIQFNRPRMLQVLLEEGVDPDRQDYLGGIALHLAALAHSLDMVRMLVEFGANAQITDDEDKTLHHVAAVESLW